MRWFLLLLLLLNAFYYVWHQQQAPLRAKEVAPLALYQGQQRDIRLLSESDEAPKKREALPAKAPEEVCLFLGGFSAEDEARRVEQRLVSLDIASSVMPLDVAAGVDYWVYLVPLASRQASLRQLKELQARKIDSYIIGQGDLANGISLGIFPPTIITMPNSPIQWAKVSAIPVITDFFIFGIRTLNKVTIFDFPIV